MILQHHHQKKLVDVQLSFIKAGFLRCYIFRLFFWILWLRETKQFREKTEHQYVSSKIEKAASLFQHLEITVFTIFMIWNFYTLFAFIAHKIVFRFKMYLFGELQ